MSAISRRSRRAFELHYKPNWHCVEGHDFGDGATHEAGRLIYYHIG